MKPIRISEGSNIAQTTHNANLDEIAQKYAGNEAAIEATSNYFTIYDTLDEHLDVTLANPLKANWLANQKQKTDRVDAKKLARFLRMGEVPESYVPPDELRKYRALSGLRKVWILAPIECMNGSRRFDVVEHLSEGELDAEINEAQKADEAE